MTSPNIETRYLHPEIFSDSKEHELGISRIAEALIRHDNPFDVGNTAAVYQDSYNARVCHKIYRETYMPGDYRNSSRQEIALMEQAAKANTDRCRVAMAYAWSKMQIPELNDDRDYLGVVEMLSMERLNAINIEQALINPNKPNLPPNFNASNFCDALEEFIERMHTIAEVHHRDLRDVNIMIDLDTGNPIVIDFGMAKSTAGLGDENPYHEDRMHDTATAIPDSEKLRNLRERLLKAAIN